MSSLKRRTLCVMGLCLFFASADVNGGGGAEKPTPGIFRRCSNFLSRIMAPDYAFRVGRLSENDRNYLASVVKASDVDFGTAIDRRFEYSEQEILAIVTALDSYEILFPRVGRSSIRDLVGIFNVLRSAGDPDYVPNPALTENSFLRGLERLRINTFDAFQKILRERGGAFVLERGGAYEKLRRISEETRRRYQTFVAKVDRAVIRFPLGPSYALLGTLSPTEAIVAVPIENLLVKDSETPSVRVNKILNQEKDLGANGLQGTVFANGLVGLDTSQGDRVSAFIQKEQMKGRTPKVVPIVISKNPEGAIVAAPYLMLREFYVNPQRLLESSDHAVEMLASSGLPENEIEFAEVVETCVRRLNTGARMYVSYPEPLPLSYLRQQQ